MTPRIGMYKERRGRSRGKYNRCYTLLRSIAFIARRYVLDQRRLVDAFIEALEDKTSHCGELKISCRAINQDSATFLITKEEKVVWQFPIALESLRNPGLLKNHIQDIPKLHYIEREIYQKKQKIDNLRFGMKRIDVKAKIIEVPQAKQVFTRWGSISYVSNVMIADETGSIRLSLWNNQIEKVHVGDKVKITNCNVSRFAGELQLRLGRKSTVSVINQVQQEELIQHSILR